MAEDTTKTWDLRELELIEAGYVPPWDAEDERLVQSLTCTRDGRMLAYVGLARGRVSVVFGICPKCANWLSFKGAQQ